MTQYLIDPNAVSDFNAKAPVLESIKIGRRTFEMVHDYYHMNPRWGNRPSVIVREKNPKAIWGGIDLWPCGGLDRFDASCPFKRNSKAWAEYQTWIKSVVGRHT